MSERHSTLTRDLIASGCGMRIFQSNLLTIERPHAMSSEPVLARVSGGRWFPKTITEPNPKLLQARDGSLYGRPATVAKLKAALAAGQSLAV